MLIRKSSLAKLSNFTKTAAFTKLDIQEKAQVIKKLSYNSTMPIRQLRDFNETVDEHEVYQDDIDQSDEEMYENVKPTSTDMEEASVDDKMDEVESQLNRSNGDGVADALENLLHEHGTQYLDDDFIPNILRKVRTNPQAIVQLIQEYDALPETQILRNLRVNRHVSEMDIEQILSEM